jgi:hypothetical protein
MAERIQRKRTKDWRMPEGAVYVGRGTKWGNPWTIQTPQPDARTVTSPEGRIVLSAVGPDADRWARTVATRSFAEWITTSGLDPTELADKDLTCWCPLPEPGQPDHCHASVLLRIAAGEEP